MPQFTTKPKIIGLTGLAGSGKDTVRSILEQRHGYIGMAFADSIRTILGSFLHQIGADRSYMHDRALKERPIPGLDVSYRHMAQTLGTEWGRSIHPDIWLRSAKARAQAHRHTHPHPLVFSDVRFANEADWVREMGGEVWRVERDAAEPVRDHVSENIDALQACRVVKNHGDMNDLTAFIDAVMWDRRAPT